MTDTHADLGRVVPEGEGAGVRLEFRRTYPDPIEEVWAAVTESDRSAAGSAPGPDVRASGRPWSSR